MTCCRRGCTQSRGGGEPPGKAGSWLGQQGAAGDPAPGPRHRVNAVFSPAAAAGPGPPLVTLPESAAGKCPGPEEAQGHRAEEGSARASCVTPAQTPRGHLWPAVSAPVGSLPPHPHPVLLTPAFLPLAFPSFHTLRGPQGSQGPDSASRPGMDTSCSVPSRATSPSLGPDPWYTGSLH